MNQVYEVNEDIFSCEILLVPKGTFVHANTKYRSFYSGHCPIDVAAMFNGESWYITPKSLTPIEF